MHKRTGWILLGAAFVGPFFGFVVACAVTYVMPKKYESQATIEVKSLSESSAPEVITPQFFGTEFEKIKSHDSLAKVVDRLELVNKWAVDQETAIRILKGIVSAQNIRGTDLISIRVRHTDKEDARDITAEVARAYGEYRSCIWRAENGSRLSALNQALQDQVDKVEKRRKTMAELVNSKNFLPPEADGITDGNKRTLGEQDYVDAKHDFETDQTLLQQIKLKQVEAGVQSKMHQDSVIVHEDPQIAESPVSPNVPVNLGLGATLGFILSPLMALPLILLLNRLNPIKVGGPPAYPG
jgi:capsular polysaccharide biosynthesis protein